MITSGTYLGITIDDHAGLILSGNGDTVIYDPGGSYQSTIPGSGSGGVMNNSDSGVTLQGYVNYEETVSSSVTTYTIPISNTDEAAIVNTLYNGNVDNTPFHCAADVSSVLYGIGPFTNLPIAVMPGQVITPGNLADSVSQISGVSVTSYQGKMQ